MMEVAILNHPMDKVEDSMAANLWTDGADLTRRPPLREDTSVDVAIVGAGYTGLWTAYYLHKLDPSLQILVIEAGHAFGVIAVSLPFRARPTPPSARPSTRSRNPACTRPTTKCSRPDCASCPVASTSPTAS